MNDTPTDWVEALRIDHATIEANVAPDVILLLRDNSGDNSYAFGRSAQRIDALCNQAGLGNAVDLHGTDGLAISDPYLTTVTDLIAPRTLLYVATTATADEFEETYKAAAFGRDADALAAFAGFYAQAPLGWQTSLPRPPLDLLRTGDAALSVYRALREAAQLYPPHASETAVTHPATMLAIEGPILAEHQVPQQTRRGQRMPRPIEMSGHERSRRVMELDLCGLDLTGGDDAGDAAHTFLGAMIDAAAHQGLPLRIGTTAMTCLNVLTFAQRGLREALCGLPLATWLMLTNSTVDFRDSDELLADLVAAMPSDTPTAVFEQILAGYVLNSHGHKAFIPVVRRLAHRLSRTPADLAQALPFLGYFDLTAASTQP